MGRDALCKHHGTTSPPFPSCDCVVLSSARIWPQVPADEQYDPSLPCRRPLRYWAALVYSCHLSVPCFFDPQVLLPRFGLPADEQYDPSEDWEDDNKGLEYMGFPNFFDALFEVSVQASWCLCCV